MVREDGTKKSDTGYLGVIKSNDGKDMTEFSIGVEIEGQETLVPTLIPGLTDDEIEVLKTEPNPKDIPKTIIKKAVDHAKKQKSEGKDIFFEKKEPESSLAIIDKIAIVESSDTHMTDGKLTESPKGALGKYQIMPKTAKKPGYGVTPIADLTKASEAEHKVFAESYYQAMLKVFDGDQEKALAAYNGGAGTVKKAIKKDPDNWVALLPKESREYITKVQTA
jgi:soluble lytic murein transglycosylase